MHTVKQISRRRAITLLVTYRPQSPQEAGKLISKAVSRLNDTVSEYDPLIEDVSKMMRARADYGTRMEYVTNLGPALQLKAGRKACYLVGDSRYIDAIL